MSDCSTEAMAHKELPRTCGNCGHACGHRTKLYGCAYDYVPCLLHGTFEHEANLCSDWEQRADTLEQCYEQLEQVALDMWSLIRNIEREYPRLLDPNCKPGGQLLYPMPSEQYACQLAELGVSVDD